ncbi:MAG TPA: hypothetical protein VMT16_14765 [Thermoanaerobaculia bacterium]|nr:hypothetical protein [Thermoanaerobaculia bacterium]
MSYPGNPSLAADAKARILETFAQTLDVAARGNLEEARLGCDFVLRLDPLFGPAQLLVERLEGATGAVEVGDLRQRLAAAQGEAAGDDLDLELADEDELFATDPAAAQHAATPEGLASPAEDAEESARLRQDLEERLARRDFAGLMRRAEGFQDTIAADPDLQRLLAVAQERIEAAPYVESFLEKARQALEEGDQEAAAAHLEKARVLDPTHPGVAAAEGVPDAGAASPLELEPMVDLDDASEPLELEPMTGEEAPGFELADDALSEPLPELDFGALADAESLDLEQPAPAPPAGGPSDADPRIAELLDAGQEAFARGELQSAIDSWSRIFLIDIDHKEAARRIETARNQKAEEERRTEEAYHEALARAEAGELDAARAALEALLAQHPGHLAARELLDKVERGDVAELAPAAGGPQGDDLLRGLEGGGAESGVLKEEILVPPEPGERPAATAAPPPPQAARPRRTFWLVAGAVLVGALAAGWFVMTRWDTLFPNSEPVVQSERPEQTPIARASQLYDQGKAAMALAQLKRVPPASPYFQEAQALIGQWEAELAPVEAEGPDPQVMARREALLQRARAAHGEQRMLAAHPLFEAAARLEPLGAEDHHLLQDAERQLQPLAEQLQLVRAEEYERAMRELWLTLEKEPQNRDARTILTVAYFNLGVRSLQQGRPGEAKKLLREAAQVDPQDAEVQRLLELADAYENREPDLLYRTFVKYLSPRAV